jgi:glycosyltransferase involved in cell wall biosynthesis
MPERNALLFMPEAPFPVRGGGRMRLQSIIEYLRQHYVLDLVIFRDPERPDPSPHLPPGLARDVFFVNLPKHPRQGLHFLWRNLRRLARRRVPLMDRFSGFQPLLRSWLEGRRYDLGLATHSWVCEYAPLLREHCERLYLDLQNVESVLLERAAGEMPLANRLAMRRFASFCRREERRWLPLWDVLLVTSEADAAYTRKRIPGVHPLVVPNTIPLLEMPPGDRDGTLAFSGTMDYLPNRLAVGWWVNEIAPALRAARPGLRLRLIGSGDSAIRALAEGRPDLEVTGEVDDAFAWIAKSSVFVVPLRTGSGTRLKILEAWAAGVPVVSTRIGAEGLPVCDGENALLAETPDEFVSAIGKILDDRPLGARLAARGRAIYEERYTWEAAFRALEAAGV